MGTKGRVIHKIPHRKMERLPKNKKYDTSIRNIFLDLDDTLIKSQEKYKVANKQCLNIFKETFNLSDEEAKELAMHRSALDAKRAIEQKRFNIKRFTYTWLEVYENYCNDRNVPVSQKIRKELKDITSKAWKPPFVMYENVLETMRSLKTEFPVARISILTLGDPKVQHDKIKSLPKEIRNYIDHVYVVENKNPENFNKVLGDLNRNRCLMIGNSEKSDVQPALEVGMKAMHIPNRGGWIAEKHKINKKHENYNKVSNFSEILEKIQEL